jgi:hypothetical protein
LLYYSYEYTSIRFPIETSGTKTIIILLETVVHVCLCIIHCRYGLELIQVSGSIQQALSQLKSSHPQLKAVCMGTRHTDPYSSNLEPFSPTDGDWPDYMRVNCILVSWWIVEWSGVEWLCIGSMESLCRETRLKLGHLI